MTQDMSEEGFLLVETSRSLSHLSTTPLCGQWSAGRGLRTPLLFSSRTQQTFRFTTAVYGLLSPVYGLRLLHQHIP